MTKVKTSVANLITPDLIRLRRMGLNQNNRTGDISPDGFSTLRNFINRPI